MLILWIALVIAWTPPDYWDADDIALEMSDFLDIWTDGGREDFSSVGGFEVAGAGVHLPASEVAFESSAWRGLRRMMAMLAWSVAVLLCLFPMSCRLCSVQNSGVPFLLPGVLSLPFSEVSMLPGILVGCWIVTAWQSFRLWLRMEIWLLLLST